MYNHDNQHDKCKWQVHDMPVSEQFLHKEQPINPVIQGNFIAHQLNDILDIGTGEIVLSQYGPDPCSVF